MKELLKICFVSTHAYSLFNHQIKKPYGGAEVQLYNLSVAFSRLPSMEVSFIVGDFGQNHSEIRGRIKLIKSFGLNRRFKYISGIPAQYKLWRALKAADADIYVQRAAGLETAVVAAFCKIHRKKFVYMTAHQKDCDGSYAKGYGLIGRLFQWGLMNSSAIITQSQDHQLLLKKTLCRQSIVMPSVYKISDHEPKKSKNILWVARAVDWKQPELFIDLARTLSNYRFTMICPQDNNQDYFLKIKRTAQAVPNLQFIDRVPFHKIDTYFKSARLFVNTSKFEGFPNTFIQAAKNKTPIISWCINPDKIFNKYNLGLVSNQTINGLIKITNKLMTSEREWRNYSQSAFDYAKKYHNIDETVTKLERIWRKLL